MSLKPSAPTKPHSRSRNKARRAPCGRGVHPRPRVCLGVGLGRRGPRQSVGDEVVRGPLRLRPGSPPQPPPPRGSWAASSQRGMNKEPAGRPRGPGRGGGLPPHDECSRPGHPGYGMLDSRAGAQWLWAALGRRWTGGMPAQTLAASGGRAHLHPTHGSLTSPSRTGPRS